MMVKTSQLARLFTVAEANAMLPLVRAITRDLVDLTREVVERHARVEHLTSGRDVKAGDPYSEELSQIAEELEKDRRRLNEFVDELRNLGVDPKSASDGIVDFPSMLDGETIELCWRLGEPEVRYWHPIGAGFARRQPIAGTAAVDASRADSV
jgi:hypothetical protein